MLLFGFRVNCEQKKLINRFLIDELRTIGQGGTSTNGSNAVISMINLAIQNTIHADNCGEQNKTQYVLRYLMCRVLTNEHTPGHARCLINDGDRKRKIVVDTA